MGVEETTPETEEPQADGGLPPEAEERIVDKVTGKLKDFVATLVGGEGDGKGEEPEAEPIDTAGSSTPRQVEADTERQVREALDKLRGEEEHRREHEKMREPERPPMVVSRLTKALWGEP